MQTRFSSIKKYQFTSEIGIVIYCHFSVISDLLLASHIYQFYSILCGLQLNMGHSAMPDMLLMKWHSYMYVCVPKKIIREATMTRTREITGNAPGFRRFQKRRRAADECSFCRSDGHLGDYTTTTLFCSPTVPARWTVDSRPCSSRPFWSPREMHTRMKIQRAPKMPTEETPESARSLSPSAN